MKRLFAALVCGVYLVGAATVVVLVWLGLGIHAFRKKPPTDEEIAVMINAARAHQLQSLWPLLLLGAAIALALVLSLGCVAGAVVCAARKKPQPFWAPLLCKLLLGPFHLVSFGLWGTLAGFGSLLGPWGIPFMLPMVVTCVLCYATLLATSAHSWVRILAARRRGALPAGWALVHLGLQLCFGLDIVSCAALLVREWRAKKDGAGRECHAN